MTSRPTWRGSLRLSLVCVPVKAFTTLLPEKGEIHLNQLHEKCHQRIRYHKTCPAHGEVRADEIVMGYQYAPDQYVEISADERASARTKSDHAIEIDVFVPLSAVDPLYFQGRNYYLLPDGMASHKPYALLHQTMAEEGRCAVAQVALSGKDQVVVLRPSQGLLLLCLMNYQSQLKDRSEFKAEIFVDQPQAEELKLAKMLLENTFAPELDLSVYQDTYTDKLREIAQAKVQGQQILKPAERPLPPTFNLIEALRKSLAKTKPRKAATKLIPSPLSLPLPKRPRKAM